MSNSFNFDEALKDLQAGKDLTGKDGILMLLIKQFTEAVKIINDIKSSKSTSRIQTIAHKVH